MGNDAVYLLLPKLNSQDFNETPGDILLENNNSESSENLTKATSVTSYIQQNEINIDGVLDNSTDRNSSISNHNRSKVSDNPKIIEMNDISYEIMHEPSIDDDIVIKTETIDEIEAQQSIEASSIYPEPGKHTSSKIPISFNVSLLEPTGSSFATMFVPEPKSKIAIAPINNNSEDSLDMELGSNSNSDMGMEMGPEMDKDFISQLEVDVIQNEGLDIDLLGSEPSANISTSLGFNSSEELILMNEPDWDVDKVVDLSQDEIHIIEEQDFRSKPPKIRDFIFNDKKTMYPTTFEISDSDLKMIQLRSKQRRPLVRLRRVFSSPNLQPPNVTLEKSSNLKSKEISFQFRECSTDELVRLGAFFGSFRDVYDKLNDLLRLHGYKYPPSQAPQNQLYEYGYTDLKINDLEGNSMKKHGAILIWQSFHLWLSGNNDKNLSKLAFRTSGGLFSGIQVEKNCAAGDIRKAFWRFWNFHISLLSNSYNTIHQSSIMPFLLDLEPVDLFMPKEKFFEIGKSHKKSMTSKRSTLKDSRHASNSTLEGVADNHIDEITSDFEGVSSDREIDDDIFGFKKTGALGEFNDFIDSDSSEFSESDGDDLIAKNNDRLAKFVKRLEYNENKNNPDYIKRLSNQSKNKSKPSIQSDNRSNNHRNLSNSNKPQVSYVERLQGFLKTQHEEHKKRVCEQRKEREVELQRRLLDQGLSVRVIKSDNPDNDSSFSIDNADNVRASYPLSNNGLYNRNASRMVLNYDEYGRPIKDMPGRDLVTRVSSYLEQTQLNPDLVQQNFQEQLLYSKERADVLGRLGSAYYNPSIQKGHINGSSGGVINLSIKEYEPILVNPGHSKSEADVFIPEFLGKWLKPHQIEGIQFMWRNVVMFHKGYENSQQHGCVIAHAMGLGKTLQVITFVYTLLNAIENDILISKSRGPIGNSKSLKLSGVPSEFKGKQILILCPPSLQINWQREFTKWLEKDGSDVSSNDIPLRNSEKEKRRLHLEEVRRVLGMVLNYDRIQGGMSYKIEIIEEWHRRGGVLILGYSQFRNILSDLDSTNLKTAKSESERLLRCLVNPGPAVVIADEGHCIKNQKSKLSISAEKIKTLARICLTGYPLQNNLDEYWTMVNFVFPKILGSFNEFHNSYAVPISNGMYADSSPAEKQLGAAKLKALQDHLSPLVLRQDSSILSADIPSKTEFFIMCSLTPLQLRLYKAYLASFQLRTGINNTGVIARYSTFTSICNHPGSVRLLIQERKKAYKKNSYRGAKRIIYGIEDEGETEELVDKGQALPDSLINESMDDSWVNSIFASVPSSSLCKPVHSSKMMVLLSILYHSMIADEKVLVFSHFVSTLDFIWWTIENSELIESVAKQKTNEKLKRMNNSKRGNYQTPFFAEPSPKIQDVVLRMDGSKSMLDRMESVDKFNDKDSKARVFLITTGTGSIGINLVGASRVVIFDVGWNPLYDEQAVARAYRYNQTKKVFVYRLISAGTWEQTLFQNNRHKVGLSLRVIDKVNTSHKVYKEATNKYYAPPKESSETVTISRQMAISLASKNRDDSVLGGLVMKNYPRITDVDYHTTSKNTNMDTSFELETLPNPDDGNNNPHLTDMIEFERSKLKLYTTPQDKVHIVGDRVDVNIEIQADEIRQSDLNLGSDWTNGSISNKNEKVKELVANSGLATSHDSQSHNPTSSLMSNSTTRPSDPLPKSSLLDSIENMIASSNEKFPRISTDFNESRKDLALSSNFVLEPTTINEFSLTKPNSEDYLSKSRISAKDIIHNSSFQSGELKSGHANSSQGSLESDSISGGLSSKKSLLENALNNNDLSDLKVIKASKIKSNPDRELTFSDPVLENSKKSFTNIIDAKNLSNYGDNCISQSIPSNKESLDILKNLNTSSNQKSSLLSFALEHNSQDKKNNQINIPQSTLHSVKLADSINLNNSKEINKNFQFDPKSIKESEKLSSENLNRPLFETYSTTFRPKSLEGFRSYDSSLKHNTSYTVDTSIPPLPSSTSILKPKLGSISNYDSIIVNDKYEYKNDGSSSFGSFTSSLVPKNDKSKLKFLSDTEKNVIENDRRNDNAFDHSASIKSLSRKYSFESSSSIFVKKRTENTIPEVITSRDISENNKNDYSGYISNLDSMGESNNRCRYPKFRRGSNQDISSENGFRNKSLTTKNREKSLMANPSDGPILKNYGPKSKNLTKMYTSQIKDVIGSPIHKQENENVFTVENRNSSIPSSRESLNHKSYLPYRKSQNQGYRSHSTSSTSKNLGKKFPQYKNMTLINRTHHDNDTHKLPYHDSGSRSDSQNRSGNDDRNISSGDIFRYDSNKYYREDRK
ncbi:Protein CHROMATIN REMODELING 20 [Smittium mucronatum]|uniref:Protein CHROMATIN REMODELING 20 n=1 Tax=Smittium mucronatum TaxID=133383 RepID=A0A1R0GV85_9FUNG|nr:Protein CHROMATIN REMODELING 20 [Smittium mucronatum]